MEIRPVEIEMAISRVGASASSGVSMSLKSPKDLSHEDISSLHALLGTVGKVIIIPNVATEAPTYKIDKSINEKSPSQRLYNVLYVLHEQNGGTQEDFRKFYEKTMEKIIDQVKEKLV